MNRYVLVIALLCIHATAVTCATMIVRRCENDDLRFFEISLAPALAVWSLFFWKDRE